MSQQITESVPRWIFMIVFGILQAVLCWISISTYNKTAATWDTVIAIAVKLDTQRRDIDKLSTDVDQLKVRSNEHEYRLGKLDDPRPVRR